MGLLAWDAVLLDEWFCLLKSYSAFISGLSSPWRISAPWFLKTMGTSHSATRCHIPEKNESLSLYLFLCLSWLQ